MQDILIKAGCYIAIILLGYTLRRRGFFGPEAFGVLSKVPQHGNYRIRIEI